MPQGSHEPTEFSYDIYGGIDAEVDAAYQQNVENGATSPDNTEGLRTVVDNLTSKDPKRSIERLSDSFLTAIENGAARARSVFEKSGLEVPDPFELNIVNWDELDTVYTHQKAIGLKPEVIIAPDFMSLDSWERLFDELSPRTRLRVVSEVHDAWDELKYSDGWSAQVMPTTEEPSLVQVSYTDDRLNDTEFKELGDKLNDLMGIDHKSIMHLHPTVAAYLTLQAQRIVLPGIDRFTGSILRNSFGGLVAVGQSPYDPLSNIRNVDLGTAGTREISAQVGLRPTLRGLQV